MPTLDEVLSICPNVDVVLKMNTEKFGFNSMSKQMLGEDLERILEQYDGDMPESNLLGMEVEDLAVDKSVLHIYLAYDDDDNTDYGNIHISDVDEENVYNSFDAAQNAADEVDKESEDDDDAKKTEN